MPTTITGRIKALLSGPLPTVPVFRDEEPVGGRPQGGKWVVVHEGLSRVPAPADARSGRLRRELVQVDVWQHVTSTTPDDETLTPTIERTLDAAPPAALAGGDGLHRLRPENLHREYDAKTQLLRESITVAVARHTT